MDENEIIERIRKHPETYRSLLGCDYGRNTDTVIMRRKILRNIKNGIIRRIYLNGSRGGEILFTHQEKDYIVIIVAEHRNFKYYVGDELIEKNKAISTLKNCRELDDCRWVQHGDIDIFVGNIVKMI